MGIVTHGVIPIFFNMLIYAIIKIARVNTIAPMPLTYCMLNVPRQEMNKSRVHLHNGV